MLIIRKHRKFILPVMIMGVFIAITFFVVISKASVGVAENRYTSVSNNDILLKDPEINACEYSVLSMLYNNDTMQEGQPSVNNRLYQYLKYYLGSCGVDLSEPKAVDAKVKISELNKIIAMEKNRDLREMTLDAKGIAINLAQLIYQTCGLELTFNLLGDIKTIAIKDGDIIYQNGEPIEQASFHLEALIVTVMGIIVLLIICIAIARKHQLFRKEEAQDSFEEKKYA